MERDFYTQEEREANRREIATILSKAIAPPSNLPAWKWCEENVVLDNTGPCPGRYDTRLTPMVRWVFDASQDPRVRRIVLQLSAQSSKTLLAILHILHTIAEDPGPAMWVMASQEHCEEFAKKRLFPAVEDCQRTAPLLPSKRNQRNKRLIQFHSMNLMLRGSNSKVGLQSDPVRRIYCDERREWKRGAIDLLRKRLRTFHNAIEISLGTAGKAGDELDTDFREGTRTEFHFTCPKCSKSQPFRFSREASRTFPTGIERGGLVWETSETTRPGGRWNEAAVKATVRYECEECGERFNNGQKFELIKSLHPVDYNPAAPRHIRSFHWSALAMPWSSCSWEELVWEFLKSKMAMESGNMEPMKAFITETLGEPWEDRLGIVDDFAFLEQRKAGYEFGSTWPEEKVRFLAADRQSKGGEHYWWVCRAFGANGQSRLVAYGRCTTQAELEEIRAKYNVKPGNSVIDSAHETASVYRFCMRSGWRPFKGDSAANYTHHERAADGTTRPIKRIWNLTKQDPGFGSANAGRYFINLYRWANDPTKDLLAEYLRGLMGDWTIPRDTGKDYIEQVTAEQRMEVEGNMGRIRYVWKRIRPDNHYWDCECMILSAACISKTIAEPIAAAEVTA